MSSTIRSCGVCATRRSAPAREMAWSSTTPMPTAASCGRKTRSRPCRVPGERRDDFPSRRQDLLLAGEVHDPERKLLGPSASMNAIWRPSGENLRPMHLGSSADGNENLSRRETRAGRRGRPPGGLRPGPSPPPAGELQARSGGRSRRAPAAPLPPATPRRWPRVVRRGGRGSRACRRLEIESRSALGSGSAVDSVESRRVE